MAATPAGPRTLRERLGALRNLPPFMKLVWDTSPGLTIAQAALRLARARVPVLTLYVGKLIIDEVVAMAQAPQVSQVGELLDTPLARYVALEFALAIGSDILARIVGLVDSLLSERVGIATSLKLMTHAATLDLEDFEDSELQDSLERARRQASGRMTLMGQIFNQLQDIVGAVVADGLRVGIHAHNDTACAVANSLAAIGVGATHVQGTANGYGERCGKSAHVLTISVCEMDSILRYQICAI